MLIAYDIKTKEPIGLLTTGNMTPREGRAQVLSDQIAKAVTDWDCFVIDETGETPVARYSQAIYDEKMGTELSQAVKDGLRAIDLWRFTQLQKGVDYTFPDGATDNIQTRDTLDIQTVDGKTLEALIHKMRGIDGYVAQFRPLSNVTREMTADQMMDMGLAVSGHISMLYQDSWQHKDLIREMDDADLIQQYLVDNNLII